MKTVLFGNGLNLLNHYTTWNDLIKRIDDKMDKYKIPNTLHYEAQVIPMPVKKGTLMFYDDIITVDNKTISFTVDEEIKFKEDIAQRMKSYESNDIYLRLASMANIRHYLTTNYDEVLKNTLETVGFKEKEKNRIESIYSIRRRCTCVDKEGDVKCIWNIHGEISSPQTIMLGFNQYCGSVSRINEYLSGKYKYKAEKTSKVMPQITDRLNDGIDSPFSWVDLFFISDIYILGFGMLYDEIDLWWILTRRRRLMRQGVPINNRIFYCGFVDPGKRELYRIMGVEIISPDADPKDYEGQYKSIIDKISTN